MNRKPYAILAGALAAALLLTAAAQAHLLDQKSVYQVGKLKPNDSQLKVAVGQQAPDFTLPSTSGWKVSLSQFRGKKNVMITFVPAAFTPVCSDQWPGYNLARSLFEKNDTVLLGISVDNVPSLYAWTRQMSADNTVWFPVLSDFWPHGKVADTLGVLRSDGMSERAVFLIDKQGVIRYIDVHDINSRPELGTLVREMQKLNQ